MAVDVGCGCGVFGLLLLDALTSQGRKLQRLCFADTHAPSLAALTRTLTRHRQQLPRLAGAELAEGSLLDPLLKRAEKAQLICANLPQTPGPAALAATRPDRCGGDDGAGLICALIAQLPAVLAEDGEVFMLHISLAHPARVASTLAANGLQSTVLAEQPRRAPLADYEAMLPGLAAYLLAEQAAGRAEFTQQGEHIDFHARLLRISRAGLL
jgi:methylase of polypeptide subunit release factors